MLNNLEVIILLALSPDLILFLFTGLCALDFAELFTDCITSVCLMSCTVMTYTFNFIHASSCAFSSLAQSQSDMWHRVVDQMLINIWKMLNYVFVEKHILTHPLHGEFASLGV